MEESKIKTAIEKAKEKVKEVSKKAKQKLTNVYAYCKEHPEDVFYGAIVVAGACSAIDKKIQHQRRRVEEYRRQHQHYDRQTNQWVDLRRPLTEQEKWELNYRHKHGERISDILADMGLIYF